MSDVAEKGWFDYDFAVLQLVPRVHRRETQNVGVLVYSPNSKFLEGRFLQCVEAFDDSVSRALDDPRLVARYLDVFQRIVRGDAEGGPIAGLSQSERFHWLSAPRSDILQPSPIHHGRCRELKGCVDELFAEFVR